MSKVIDPLNLVRAIVEEIHDTKGQDVKVLHLKGLVSYTDYFVLVTGTSNRHVQAMADRVHLKLKNQHQQLPITFEGYDTGAWVLLDYGDVVLHIFQEEQREFYALDDLWVDAPQVDLENSEKTPVNVKSQ